MCPSDPTARNTLQEHNLAREFEKKFDEINKKKNTAAKTARRFQDLANAAAETEVQTAEDQTKLEAEIKELWKRIGDKVEQILSEPQTAQMTITTSIMTVIALFEKIAIAYSKTQKGWLNFQLDLKDHPVADAFFNKLVIPLLSAGFNPLSTLHNFAKDGISAFKAGARAAANWDATELASLTPKTNLFNFFVKFAGVLAGGGIGAPSLLLGRKLIEKLGNTEDLARTMQHNISFENGEVVTKPIKVGNEEVKDDTLDGLYTDLNGLYKEMVQAWLLNQGYVPTASGSSSYKKNDGSDSALTKDEFNTLNADEDTSFAKFLETLTGIKSTNPNDDLPPGPSPYNP